MTFSLKKLVGFPSSTAEVVDNHLILSLPNAAEPVVWRMALDKIGTAAFEVKQDGNSEITKLILNPKKGTAEIIAPFNNKNDAVHALMATSNALQKTPSRTAVAKQSSINKENTNKENTDKENTDKENTNKENTGSYAEPLPQQTASKNTEIQKWMIAVLGAFIVIGLYYYLTTLIPTTTVGFDNQSTAGLTTPPQQSTGVPVSADDFLSGL